MVNLTWVSNMCGLEGDGFDDESSTGSFSVPFEV